METKIKETVAAVLSLSPAEITDQTSVDTVRNWDSLRHMNLIVALEGEFSIRFREEDIPAMTNMPLIRHMVAQELERKPTKC